MSPVLVNILWCGIIVDKSIALVFINVILNGEKYRDLVRNVSPLLFEDLNFEVRQNMWFS